MAIYSLKNKRVFVAGHRGMVGSALVRRLGQEGCEILTAPRQTLDLTYQDQVDAWMRAHRPHAVIIAAAKVGGILANNSFPVDFLHQNLAIANNLIHAAYETGVEKLLYLGSSCIYPREAPQPLREEYFMTGPLEPTNEWYAVAKIAGIKLAQAYRRQYGCDFISAMPTNLYGPGDNYHPEHSHVVAALIRRFHEAKMDKAQAVEIWGTGKPRREFMYVEDCADALVFMLKNYSDEGFLNVGTGEDISIADFAREVARVVGWQGELRFNTEKPDGMMRKLMDVSKLRNLGWQAQTTIQQGLPKAYADYVTHHAKVLA